MNRKLKYLFVVFIGLLLGSDANAQTAPAAEKTYRDNAAALPVFSHEAGWYEAGFPLTLSSADPGAEIRYTLDGTEPTAASRLYGGPIAVRDRSGDRNQLSIKPTSIKPVTPEGPVFKATVVRARAFVADAMSRVATRTYLVDRRGADRYNFPVIALTLDPAGFFDYETGIYVTGRVYAEHRNYRLQDWEQEANYTQSGAEWERPAYLEFFESDGERVLAQDIGIRIHGGATRSNTQKSLRIYARDLYKGDPKDFRYEIFPGLRSPVSGEPIDRFRRFLLRNAGNDGLYTYFRDVLMTGLVADTALDIQAARPAVVLVDGEYWGIHNLRERFDEYYVQNAYGIDKDDVVILENDGVVDVGESGDDQPYRDLVRFLRTEDLSDPANYRQIQTMIDVDNFIEYEVAQIYFANLDWPGNNLKFWRKRTEAYESGAGAADGRWRWLLYDTDFGFALYKGPEAAEHDTLAFATQPGLRDWPNPDWSTLILRTLLRNDDFRAAFISRFADRLNAIFHPEQVRKRIADLSAVYAGEMAEHIKRWRMPYNLDSWRENVGLLEAFAERRPDAVRGHIETMFSVQSCGLGLSWDAASGKVAINSLLLEKGDHALVYFSGVPVVLRAVPSAGSRFVAWRITDRASGAAREVPGDPRLELVLDADTVVEALFQAAGTDAAAGAGAEVGTEVGAVVGAVVGAGAGA